MAIIPVLLNPTIDQKVDIIKLFEMKIFFNNLMCNTII